MGLVQIFLGLWLDGRRDPTVRRYALWAPIYPIAYWLLQAVVTVQATLPGFLRRPAGAVVWGAARYRS